MTPRPSPWTIQSQRSADRIRQFQRQGTTILLVSHSMAMVEAMCAQAAWLERGILRESGPAAEVVARYRGSQKGAATR